MNVRSCDNNGPVGGTLCNAIVRTAPCSLGTCYWKSATYIYTSICIGMFEIWYWGVTIFTSTHTLSLIHTLHSTPLHSSPFRTHKPINAYMHIYIRTHVYVYIYVYIQTYIYVQIHIYIYTHIIYIHTHTHLRTYMCVYSYAITHPQIWVYWVGCSQVREDLGVWGGGASVFRV